MREQSTIIVGGGIWGLSIAYHLSTEPGHEVVLLERNSEIGQETTRQSAGQVGQLRADATLAGAVGYTLDLLSGFEQKTGHSPGFVRSGSLHISLHPERTAMFRRLAEKAISLGIRVDRIGPLEAKQLAPAFKFSTAHSAMFVPNDGYVSASACAEAFANAAVDQGVKLMRSVQVEDIETDSPIRKSVITNQGTYACDNLVIACGPWTGIMAKRFGISLPMHPIRLQQARTVSLGVPETHPVVRIPDESCYVRPERGGFLFGYFDSDPLAIDLLGKPKSFRTMDIKPEVSLVSHSAKRLNQVLPGLSELRIDEYRQGMMTCTPDGKFVLGRLPGSERVWVATGCGGTGIAASGAIGNWVSNWISNGSPGEDISCYDPGRFGQQTDDVDWLRESCRKTSAAYYRLSTID